jgi:hypothetical protein
VVSLYARVDSGPDGQREVRTRVSSLLDEIRPLAKDGIAQHDWRMSLRGDIDRIKTAVGEERWPPAAIAIFACSGRGLYTEATGLGGAREGGHGRPERSAHCAGTPPGPRSRWVSPNSTGTAPGEAAVNR